MLVTEVPQELHLAVTGENPSAVRTAGAPVDSVTHEEAEAACRRLGWLLGRRVRLAGPDDYAAAAADPAFRGLKDGLEEWAAPSGTATFDRLPVLGAATSRDVHRRERSRTIGYRIVVEQ